MTHKTVASPRMSEEQVRERLRLINEPKVANELYAIGQSIINEVIVSIRTLENKATLFAAYGTGIVTLLVSSYAMWSKQGNEMTLWIGAYAGLTALLCTLFSVKALTLKTYKITSQKEWLEPYCLESEIKLKKYHILATWDSMGSRLDVQQSKLRELHKAQRWLTVTVATLAFLLFQVALLGVYRFAQLYRWGGIGNELRMQGWQFIFRHTTALGWLSCFLALGLIWILIFRSDRLA